MDNDTRTTRVRATKTAVSSTPRSEEKIRHENPSRTRRATLHTESGRPALLDVEVTNCQFRRAAPMRKSDAIIGC